jgi:hypothetical protein
MSSEAMPQGMTVITIHRKKARERRRLNMAA